MKQKKTIRVQKRKANEEGEKFKDRYTHGKRVAIYKIWQRLTQGWDY